MHPIFESLRTPPPRVTREQATDFLNREFGVSGALEPVDSERDLNFRVRCTGEQDFVLKIANVTEARAAAEELGFPLVFKPPGQGSSIGMSKVFDAGEIEEAFQTAAQYGPTVIIESCVVGAEVTVAVLQGTALPSVRIETPRVFYDYRAKYESDRTTYTCPGSEDPEVESGYAQMALRAFNELGCSGWGRVDFMHAKGGEPQVLEVNTVPGMTSHSLVPMAADAAGIGFAELCWRILETSCGSEMQLPQRRVASNGA